MKLLVTGASGLLGHKVAQLALEKGHEVYSIYKEHMATLGTSIKLDITDREKLLKVISKRKPDTVIHTAAYTDVDGCEINRDLAWKVNAEATKHLAIASTRINSHLTYVSTDYVFDGDKGLYKEDNSPNPISHYGYTKLKGEEFVKEHSKAWCIARASVIYGWGPTPKQNFATWLLDNLNQGKDVKILTDQYVSPTLNTNLAEMLLEIAERKITGTLHTAGATRVSRHEFALKLAEVFNLNMDLVKPAKMNEMSWKAKRPRDSSLNVGRALALLNQKPLKLNQALKMMRRELSAIGEHTKRIQRQPIRRKPGRQHLPQRNRRIHQTIHLRNDLEAETLLERRTRNHRGHPAADRIPRPQGRIPHAPFACFLKKTT